MIAFTRSHTHTRIHIHTHIHTHMRGRTSVGVFVVWLPWGSRKTTTFNSMRDKH